MTNRVAQLLENAGIDPSQDVAKQTIDRSDIVNLYAADLIAQGLFAISKSIDNNTEMMRNKVVYPRSQ